MKKIIFITFILSLSLFAREAIVKEILSENMILIEQKGITKRAQLAGIAQFIKINQKNRKISFKERERLRKKAMDFLQESIPVGKKIEFIKIDNDSSLDYIWVSVDKKELNYLMVKNGYALLDANDPYLLGMFHHRLKVAMNYAKREKTGLWKSDFEKLEKLVTKRSYYGSQNKNVSKEDILGFFKDRIK